MIDDAAFGSSHDEMERNAYNAAFYELGLRWHWDSDTYNDLTQRSANISERIRYYLETRHPHLLKAYDADFLAVVIEQKKESARSQRSARGHRSCHFDWAQTLAGELGA